MAIALTSGTQKSFVPLSETALDAVTRRARRQALAR
jgi:hypothetical protein